MGERILFHTPQEIDGDLDSGSIVRPMKMLNAFKELGYNIDIVAGSAEARRAKIREIKANDIDYSFCYSEPTTWPLNPFVDYRLYYYLRSANIPTGIFYRDAYWKFPELFNKPGLKWVELQLRYRLDLAVMSRTASKIYVPSESFEEFLGLNTPTDPLPPGGEDKIKEGHLSTSLERLIYVGGISNHYGAGIIAETMEQLDRKHDVHLDLVCRKQEFEVLSCKDRFDADWVTVHHKSGNELEQLYYQADAALILGRPIQYFEMAIPVKLFEYLSYGLPVITTDCREIASIIQQTNCGVVADNDSVEISSRVSNLIKDVDEFRRLVENTTKALSGNLWTDRAKHVAQNLTDVS